MEQENELYRALSVARDFDEDDPILREMGDAEYDVYALMRKSLPVARSERMKQWIFFNYDDCKDGLQRYDLFSNDTRKFPVRWIPQQSDPPEQREYRRVLDPLFSPQVMAKLEGDIRSFANELIDPILARGECDFVEDFALPFPTKIFCRLMGFPLEDHEKLMHWEYTLLHAASTVIADRLGIAEREPSGRPKQEVVDRLGAQAAQELMGYLAGLFEQRRQEPKNDLLTMLLDARVEGTRPMTQDELLNMSFLLFLAGLDTVTGMLSMIMRDFAEHPEHRRGFVELMNDEDRVTTAIEELVRYHSTVPLPRRVAKDCVFRDVAMREDEDVLFHIPSADRDECAFAKADEIDYDRLPNPHLGFAVGPHRCLGIHLARRELRIALQEWHRRVPEYAVKPDGKVLVYTGGLRGLISLPLVLQPAPAK